MLLAKVEQTDERLVITPQKSPANQAFIWVLLGGVTAIESAHLLHSTPLGAFFLAVFSILARVTYVPKIFPQWFSLVLDRTRRKVSLNGHFLGLFSNIISVNLLKREMSEGRSFRLVLVMTNLDEWKIFELSLPTFLGRSSPFRKIALTGWEPYPPDDLPNNATEYKLVMLANLIHNYLGLPEAAPCKHSVPLPSETLNRMP